MQNDINAYIGGVLIYAENLYIGFCGDDIDALSRTDLFLEMVAAALEDYTTPAHWELVLESDKTARIELGHACITAALEALTGQTGGTDYGTEFAHLFNRLKEAGL